MRYFGAALVATALMMGNAFAEPLAPGKPAGVKQAQAGSPNTLMIIAGIGIVGLGIGLVASGKDGSKPSVTTTGTAP
jgi:hypothetical protein